MSNCWRHCPACGIHAPASSSQAAKAPVPDQPVECEQLYDRWWESVGFDYDYDSPYKPWEAGWNAAMASKRESGELGKDERTLHSELKALASVTPIDRVVDAMMPVIHYYLVKAREYNKQEREVISLAFHCKIFLHEMMMGAAHGELPHHLGSPEAKAEWEHYVKEAEKLHDMFDKVENANDTAAI